MRFVVDGSAVMAIRLSEPERETFHSILLAGEPVLSVASLAELTMVWQARLGPADLGRLDRTLDLYGIAVEPVAAEDRMFLREAVTRFGKGRRREPAVLNFGDLFAYALARRLDLPLLYKGTDFTRTDIASVPYPSA